MLTYVRHSTVLCRLALVGFAIQGPGADAQEVVPQSVGQRIVAFVLDHEGKKVGRGECWDLAAQALDHAGATWDGEYGFGTVVDWKRDTILPGDIVQFANVIVERRTAGGTYSERYGQHTAIIIEVRGRGDFTIAHQNMDPFGMKVGRGALRMADVRSGKLVFHHPSE